MKIFETYRSLYKQKAMTMASFKGSPYELYEPMAYIMRSGGKHLRPSLAYWVSDMYGDIGVNHHWLAIALETFHNFTLVHDDIMDEASLRRGRLTVYQKWGRDGAILSGDLMHIEAMNFLSKIEHPEFKMILVTFLNAARRVCEGQQLDMAFTNNAEVGWEDYEEMIEGKTSVLIALACKLGAMLGNAKTEEQALWWDFGLSLGQAFQIQDDFLDAFGDEGKTGKKVGGDIVESKKAAPYILLMERIDPKQRAVFDKLYSSQVEEKVEQVLDYFSRYSIDEYVREKLQQKIMVCRRAASQLSVYEEKKQSFESIIELITLREQ